MSFSLIGVIDIAKHLKQLRHLTLDHTGVTDEGFVHATKYLHQLLSISLEGCQISDNGLVAASEYLEDLEEFNFGSEFIEDYGVIYGLPQCKALTDLKLSFCPNITTNSVRFLDRHLPCLLHLGIEECAKLSHQVISDLRSQCRFKISLI